MNKTNSDQYVTTKNLDIRISFNEKYSTNPTGWLYWLYNHYTFSENDYVLELGCGNGSIWRANIDSLSPNVQLVLTDISNGMLNSARDSLSNVKQIKFSQMDAQNIHYPDNSFDVVIANHMLYHVDDLSKALGEIVRVLKPNGMLYASTIGLNNQEELRGIIENIAPHIDFTQKGSAANIFGLENGKELLTPYFVEIECDTYKDHLLATTASDVIKYLLSFHGIHNTHKLSDHELSIIQNEIEVCIIRYGSFQITKHSGVFSARKRYREV